MIANQGPKMRETSGDVIGLMFELSPNKCRAYFTARCIQTKDVVRQLRRGQSVRNTAKITGKGVSTVQRVKFAMAA